MKIKTREINNVISISLLRFDECAENRTDPESREFFYEVSEEFATNFQISNLYKANGPDACVWTGDIDNLNIKIEFDDMLGSTMKVIGRNESNQELLNSIYDFLINY